MELSSVVASWWYSLQQEDSVLPWKKMKANASKSSSSAKGRKAPRAAEATTETLLHAACVDGDYRLAFELTNRIGVDVNDASEEEGQTPLMEAAANGHLEAARVLLECGSDVIEYLRAALADESSALHCVRLSGYLGDDHLGFRFCVHVDATDYSGRTALWLASRNGHARIAGAILESGADVDLPSESGRSPLFIACRLGHLDVARRLLAHGADANRTTKFRASPLDATCQYQESALSSQHSKHSSEVEIASLLIDMGADVDFAGTGCTALYAACQAANVNLARALLDRGADLNKPANSGFSCLQVAIRPKPDDDDATKFKRLLLETLLLEHGARLC